MKKPHENMHLAVPAVYAFAGVLWILFSDVLLFGQSIEEGLLSISTLKGFGFVFVTAGLLVLLLKREQRRRRSYERELWRHTELQRAINEASPLGLFSLDPEGRVLSWNDSAQRIFGWTRKDVLGKRLPIVPSEEQDGFDALRQRILQGEIIQGQELQRQRKDGSLLEVSLFAAAIADNQGQNVGIMAAMEDISVRKANERLISKLNRLYAVRSNINQAIVRLRHRQELFEEACRIAVEDGGFVQAFAGFMEEQGFTLLASCGKDDGFTKNLAVSPRDVEEGQAPLHVALREGRHVVISDLRDAEPPPPHQAAALERGYRAAAAFPLQPFGETKGAFVLFSREAGFFDDEEIKLLDELARNISMAVELMEQDALRRRAEESLRESESRYRSLFEKNHAVMLLIDPANGDIVDANPAACAYYGWERQTLRSMRITQINTLSPEEVRQEMGGAMARGGNSYHFNHRLADGQVRDVEVYTGPILLGEQRLLYSLVFDITTRLQAEEALREAKEAAEAASRVKTEFLANMSHELRTPLNGVQGMLQLLENTRLDEKQQLYVETSIISAQRLTRLLSDVLDLSRLEAGTMTMEKEWFDLEELLQEVEELFRPTVMQSGVPLRWGLDADVPRKVRGDAPRLLQVLTNLAGNALKFTTEGEVRIWASLLQCKGSDCRLLFSVEDTGVGVEAEKLDKLFEPFTQASEGYRRQYQGAGLGLAICQRLVRLMGGTISMESEPGQGARVYFALPLETDPATRGEPRPEGQAGAQTSGSGEHVPQLAVPLHVLYAEDDMVNRLSVSKMLEKMGCSVSTANDGSQALEELQGGEFDAVFMDIQMPVMDGIEAAQRIRKGEAGSQHQEMPIIALTSYAMPGDRERFLQAGMDDYISKPVGMDELAQALEKVSVKLAG